MRILHIETRRHMSGGAKQVITLMKGMQTHGVQSLLLCPDDSVVAEFARSENLPIKVIDYKGSHDFTLVKKIRQATLEYRPDVVHAHSGRGTADFTALFSRRFDIPTLLTQRTIRAERRLLSRFKYRSFNRVVSISEAVDKSLARQGVDSQSRSIIYDGVDFSEFTQPHPRNKVLDTFDLPSDAIVLGNVGRFNENKGQLNLLEAFTHLYHDHHNLHLVLFGDGEMLDDLLYFIKEHKLEGRVHIAGFKNDLSKWYASMDILVHTAKLEALSSVILEANANGIPAIAYNAGGVAEVMEHARSGLLVQPEQVDQLVDAIERLLQDVDLRKKMGLRAKTFCQKYFDAQIMCRKYSDLYQDLVQ